MMFELVGVSNQIPMLGVRDVSEILDLITNTAATTLTQSRPLKVINYLKVCICGSVLDALALSIVNVFSLFLFHI